MNYLISNSYFNLKSIIILNYSLHTASLEANISTTSVFENKTAQFGSQFDVRIVRVYFTTTNFLVIEIPSLHIFKK